MVIIKNDFFLTRVKNSRFNINKILFITIRFIGYKHNNMMLKTNIQFLPFVKNLSVKNLWK
jgi:hypothetical protein